MFSNCTMHWVVIVLYLWPFYRAYSLDTFELFIRSAIKVRKIITMFNREIKIGWCHKGLTYRRGQRNRNIKNFHRILTTRHKEKTAVRMELREIHEAALKTQKSNALFQAKNFNIAFAPRICRASEPKRNLISRFRASASAESFKFV